MRMAWFLIGLLGTASASGLAAEPAPPITALALTPDGTGVLVGSQAGLELLRTSDLKPVRRLTTELLHLHDLSFSPDGKTLAAAGGNPARSGGVEFFRWPESSLIRRVHPNKDLIYGLSWQADGRLLATASADRTVSLIETATGNVAQVLEGHSRAVVTAVFLPGEDGLVTAGVDESLRLWNPRTGQVLRTFANHTRPVHHLALKPGGDRTAPPTIASVSDDRTVRFWQPTLGRMVRFVRLPSVPLSACWTGDGKWLVVACKDGRLRAIDPEEAEVRLDVPGLEGVAYSLVAMPDGSLLIGGEKGQLRRHVLTASGGR